MGFLPTGGARVSQPAVERSGPKYGGMALTMNVPKRPVINVMAWEADQTAKSHVTGGMQHGQPPTRRDAEDAMYARAARAGLCGPLGKRRSDEWDGELFNGRGVGAPLVDELRIATRRRIMRNMDVGKMGTALAWFEDFRRDTTRVPFVPLEGSDDKGASMYNAETLELMAEYMRLRGARRGGGAVSADHIQSTVSMVRNIRSAEAHYGIVVPQTDIVISGLYKNMRKEQGPKGERRECAPFRARHFRLIIKAGKRNQFTDVEWAIALVAHNLLLRGGEVGRTDSRPFDTARDLTLVSIILHEPCAESGWRPWLTIWLVSIKDVNAKFRIVPLQICARADASDTEMCAYTALARHVRRMWQQVPACSGSCEWCKPTPGAARTGKTPPATCRRAQTPLFQLADGEPYTTEDVRVLGRRYAVAADMPPASVGGKLWRIGGASDLHEVLGGRSETLLRQRGRWATDIAFIYARANMGLVLEASARMADADKRTVEEMEAGWVQPATFR